MKKFTKLLVAFLLVLTLTAVTACKGPEEKKYLYDYTYNSYTTVSPSNWNELTYQDNNDTQILSYISGGFFEFNYKFDAQGNIVDGDFVIDYSAATALKDVSAQYASDPKYGIAEDDIHRAYEITLRSDLKWDDGTPIKASDFVYSMKEQLNPLFNNYRADSYYVGSTIIHNAENYAKQGQLAVNDNGVTEDLTVADLVKGTDGVYKQADGKNVYIPLKEALDWCSGYTITQLYKSYFDETAYNALLELADEAGNVKVTDASLDLLATLINTENWGFEDETHIPLYFKYEKEYPQVSFDEVGIKAISDTKLVIILAKPLDLVDENGNLTYKAAYNLSGLPLVKESLYEQCKQAPQAGSTLWTSNYNSSKETTASWGPYKLESFQAGKEYVLVKNDNWYGYNMAQYKDQYQTERVVCETIKEWNTAFLKFLAGGVTAISIDVSVSADYKNSERAYYTPSSFVSSLQLQSNEEALKARETEGKNKTLLTYVDFRKALSLSINRNDFANETTTSSLAGYGLFNTMHYYDVANGKTYRNELVAKMVLCDVYGVNVDDFANIDAAVDSITGFNLTLARELATSAYNQAIADGKLKSTDKIALTFGSSTLTTALQRTIDFIQAAWVEMVKTTPLEGKLEFDFVEKGDAWSNDFRNGAYDVCTGGWSGAAWDPGYFLLAYLSPAYMYSAAWKTDEVQMTFTMPGVGADGADVTDTMSLLAWYNVLNGAKDAKYDWSSGKVPEAKRVLLIAALEKEVLTAYYSVPLANQFSASLMSYKCDYISYEYNTFMGFGGIRYLTYNYTDKEWDAFVAKNNNELNYKA